MVVFIGLLMVFISLISPGANAAWTNLQSSLQVGPQFPTYINPFTQIKSYAGLIAVANGSNPPASTHNCPSNAWWQCLTPGAHSSSSWLTTTNSINNFTVRLSYGDSGVAFSKQVLQMQLSLGCNSTTLNGTSVEAIYLSPHANGSGPSTSLGVLTCSSSYPVAYINGTQMGSLGLTLGSFAGQYLFVQGNPANFDALSITLGMGDEILCAGKTGLDLIGCNVNAGVQLVSLVLVSIGEGIIFVLAWLGAIIVFIGQILFGVMLGLFASLLYFLNLPGAPTWVQGVIDAIFIGFLVFLSLAIADRAVGLFGGAVNKA